MDDVKELLAQLIKKANDARILAMYHPTRALRDAELERAERLEEHAKFLEQHQ